jgi:uncharacterized protein YjbI with pentapeptide repeats
MRLENKNDFRFLARFSSKKRRKAMTKVMVMVCMVVFVGIFLLPCGTVAFNQAQLGQLKATQKCPDCDLSGADLTAAALTAANLTEATWTDGSKCKSESIGRCIK